MGDRGKKRLRSHVPPATAATSAQVAMKAPEKRLPPPETGKTVLQTETPSRGKSLSACPDIEHEWTGGSPTSPS